MKRTQIYLDPAQQNILRAMASERSHTVSELIREAIWDFIGRFSKRRSNLANLANSLADPLSDPLSRIVGMYHNEKDREGSLQHDDLYEE